MTRTDTMLATLMAKDEIRELAMLYSRGCDRKDFDLVRELYAKGSTDTHGDVFDGPADEYVDFLARSLPHAPYTGHHICNHLISVDVSAGVGEGEVYVLAFHIYPNDKGEMIEDFMTVRYIDRYRIEDERWRFAQRVVTFDMRTTRPYPSTVQAVEVAADPSYRVLTSSLFARGPRA
jgi:hypothetical protein